MQSCVTTCACMYDIMYVCAHLCKYYMYMMVYLEEKEEFDVSGKKVYLKACEIMGIIPASYFVRNIQEPQIIMPHHGIGGKGAKAIAVALVVSVVIML